MASVHGDIFASEDVRAIYVGTILSETLRVFGTPPRHAELREELKSEAKAVRRKLREQAEEIQQMGLRLHYRAPSKLWYVPYTMHVLMLRVHDLRSTRNHG